jgi:hypothetical protein
MMRRVYVASSWRNERQLLIVETLRAAGHQVYDFKNPAPGNTGFSWKQVSDKPPAEWTVADYKAALDHPISAHGFMCDFRAMRWADTFVLVLPCGRSAHLELGWATGAGKRTVILTRDSEEPELMALLADHIVGTVHEMLTAVESVFA